MNALLLILWLLQPASLSITMTTPDGQRVEVVEDYSSLHECRQAQLEAEQAVKGSKYVLVSINCAVSVEV